MDVELQKLAKAANTAFGSFKARLRREGHVVKQDTDYRTVSGISETAKALRAEWLEAEENLDKSATGVRQLGLPGLSTEKANPLGLIFNSEYKRISDSILFTFRGYMAPDDVYSFWHPKEGGMRGGEVWVKETFDLTGVSGSFEGSIPSEDAAIDGGVAPFDGDIIIVKKVSPERFAQLAGSSSQAGLSKKNPVAKSIEMMSDVSYVVTFVDKLEDPEEAFLVLHPCSPVTKDTKGEGVFKCGSDKWKLGEKATRVLVRIAPVQKILDEPDNGTAVQADPMEWLRNFHKGGFIRGEALDLSPRSFNALGEQLGFDMAMRDTFFVEELGLTISASLTEGVDIPGYEELPPQAEEELPPQDPELPPLDLPDVPELNPSELGNGAELGDLSSLEESDGQES